MIIFKKEKDKNDNSIIVKYEVNCDKNAVLDLRDKVILKCSIVNQVDEVISNKKIDYLARDEHVHNFFQGEFVDKYEYFDSADVDMYYRCTYELYTYSNLVTVIDKLLRNDVSVMPDIKAILSGTYQSPRLDEAKITLEQLSAEIDKIDNSLFELKVEKLKEYNSLLDEYNQALIANENEKKLVEELRSLISINKVESLKNNDIANLNKILCFFGGFDSLENYFLDNRELLLTEKIKKKKLERKK